MTGEANVGRLNPNFHPVPLDFYPTPARALPPLLKVLRSPVRYIEPAAGDGTLVDMLAGYGHVCVKAFDIKPRCSDITARSALDLTEGDIGDATVFLTNLPWSWPLFPDLVRHLIALRPLWTLAPARFAHAARSAPLMDMCRDIIALPRLKWFPDSKAQGMQDSVWLHFDGSHRGGPHFHPRATSSADAKTEAHSSVVGSSTVARLMACPASYETLRQVSYSVETPSIHAEIGIAPHEAADNIIGNNPDPDFVDRLIYTTL